MSDSVTTLNNYLWTYRKRSGYTQQDVARLLGFASSNQISRYERGWLPSLKVAIGFEIIYNASIWDLFRGLYDEERYRIEQRRAQLANRHTQNTNQRGTPPEFLPRPQRHGPVILALDLSSRYFGIAIFEGSSLIHWGVKELRRIALPQRLLVVGLRAVLGLIERFHPTVLALAVPDFARAVTAGALLKTFCTRLCARCRRRGMSVCRYTAKQVKARFAGDQRTTKQQIGEAIARWYPELSSRLPKPRKPGHPEDRRQQLFDAVAVGLTCLYGTLHPVKPPLLNTANNTDFQDDFAGQQSSS